MNFYIGRNLYFASQVYLFLVNRIYLVPFCLTCLTSIFTPYTNDIHMCMLFEKLSLCTHHYITFSPRSDTNAVRAIPLLMMIASHMFDIFILTLFKIHKTPRKYWNLSEKWADKSNLKAFVIYSNSQDEGELWYTFQILTFSQAQNVVCDIHRLHGNKIWFQKIHPSYMTYMALEIKVIQFFLLLFDSTRDTKSIPQNPQKILFKSTKSLS